MILAAVILFLWLFLLDHLLYNVLLDIWHLLIRDDVDWSYSEWDIHQTCQAAASACKLRIYESLSYTHQTALSIYYECEVCDSLAVEWESLDLTMSN